jgi:HK97 family phage major capsid protein
MALDLSRVSGSLSLPAADSGILFASVTKASAFQKAATQISLPGTGTTVHNIGKTTASVVGETDIKPVSTPALASKTVTAHTFSVLVPVSNQLLSDASAIVNVIKNDAPLAIAAKFDAIVAGEGTAPSNFAALDAAASQEVSNYATFIAALGAVAANGSRPTAVVLSTAMFYNLLAIVNGLGAPAFAITDSTINGLPYYLYDAAAAEGYVGDFSRAVWGNVEGVSLATSDSATITGVGNLFERNMTAIRVEARLGFQIADIADFVKIVAAA